MWLFVTATKKDPKLQKQNFGKQCDALKFQAFKKKNKKWRKL